jgi:2-polyprenyl-6-methoxyphenol hydroxylase-like FAD-dependent oxidoreductase
VTARQDGVTATLRDAAGREETVMAEWLVGCDGAHSTVLLQSKLVADEYPERSIDRNFPVARTDFPDSRLNIPCFCA